MYILCHVLRAFIKIYPYFFFTSIAGWAFVKRGNVSIFCIFFFYFFLYTCAVCHALKRQEKGRAEFPQGVRESISPLPGQWIRYQPVTTCQTEPTIGAVIIWFTHNQSLIVSHWVAGTCNLEQNVNPQGFCPGNTGVSLW